MEDREWMYTGRAGWKDMTIEWIAKSERFLNVAFTNGQEKAFCLCSVCQNDRRMTRVDMGKHLQKNGFVPNYKRWIYHGEVDRTREEVVRQRTNDDGTGVDDMLDDYGDAHEPPTEEEPYESAKAYYDMLASAEKPLHDHTKVCQPVSEYHAYALSHKAKASVVTPYNDSDPAEAYTSLTSYANMQQYKEVFQETHGDDSDPTIQPLDPEVVMVAGRGKKHGRFMMGGSLLSTASVRTLPQIKAR